MPPPDGSPRHLTRAGATQVSRRRRGQRRSFGVENGVAKRCRLADQTAARRVWRGRRHMAMLEVSGLTKKFGGFTAVNNVSFEVAQGEILGLIGPNGSGKSTTFNCVAGMYTPTAGKILFEGREIGGLQSQSSLPSRHRPHLSDPPPVPQSHPARERRAVGPFRHRTASTPVPSAGSSPRRRWPWSACRRTHAARPMVSARRP